MTSKSVLHALRVSFYGLVFVPALLVILTGTPLFAQSFFFAGGPHGGALLGGSASVSATTDIPPQNMSLISGGHTILYYPTQECCQPLTEGEFAILYAQGLGLPEPTEGWTVQSASAALTDRLKFVPVKRQWDSEHKTYTYKRRGWHLSDFLTEEVFFDALKASENPKFDRKPFTNGFNAPDLTQRIVSTPDGYFELNYTAGDPDAQVRLPEVRAAVMKCDCITQGEFASLFAQKIDLDPRVLTWSPGLAANELLAKCYYPRGGWQLNKCLTNEDFFNLLKGTEFDLRTGQAVDPNGFVTPLQALAVLEKQPFTTEAELAILFANRIGMRPPPGGWTADAAIQRLSGYDLSPSYGWVQCVPGCAADFEKLLKRAAMPANQYALTGPLQCEPLRPPIVNQLIGQPPTNPPGPPPPPPPPPPSTPTLPPPEE
ncbi:MAG: hypothetical protein PHX83_13615 [Acidobacteriia bacterium]|nr:hypothetical protein [Terriglobia bacterium]